MEPRTTIVEQFEDAARKFPANKAILIGDGALTYGQLNKRANALASRIRSSAYSEAINVALLLDHNEGIIIGILGVLKAGKTYVPIDPLFPLERSKNILKSSDAHILIVSPYQRSLAHKLQGAAGREMDVIDISGEMDANETDGGLTISGSQPAYILYTSGSTGVPKGVMQSHTSTVQFLTGYIREMDIRESDNILLTTPYSHTVSVIDIFSALFSGASLTIFNVKKDFDAQGFGGWIREKGVTILHTVPTFYRHFIKTFTDRAAVEKLRLVILGGEEVFHSDWELYKEYLSDECLFVNLYGSSEVILGTLFVLDKSYSDERKIVPVGFPFDMVKMLILDENHQEVPPLGTGEIYFAADFLDPAYYKDVAGTNGLFFRREGEDQKFVRMGDLAQLLPDGSIRLAGRKDSQVKIGGNRVHLNEIEVNLAADAAIEQSVVLSSQNDNGELFLVAYVKTKEKNPDIDRIKEQLRRKLPEYMIPSHFIRMEKIPITPNGKVDRNNLPKMDQAELQNIRETGKKTELQKKILKIWKSVFEKEDISIHDNYFQLGGNSLIASQMVHMIKKSLGIEVELSAVFDHQTVFALSAFLESRKHAQLI